MIAVDGPVAAGKGTLARRLAAHLGLRHLDSGLLYRAVAARLIRAGEDPADAGLAAAAARGIVEADLAAPDLRDEAVGRGASLVSTVPAVREALVAYQHEFGRTPPGAVIDGRDIGTVVFPDADHKLFVTASLEARALRRHRELCQRGDDSGLDAVRRNMAARDERDRGRAIAPLVAADDAVELDTSDLDADQTLAAALAIVGAGNGQ